MRIDFEALATNKFQQGQITRLIQDNDERRKLVKPVEEDQKGKRLNDTYIITDDIVIAEALNPFKETVEEFPYLYTAYINGKQVMDTSTLTLDSAIILAICAKNNEAGALKYISNMIGLKAF